VVKHAGDYLNFQLNWQIDVGMVSLIMRSIGGRTIEHWIHDRGIFWQVLEQQCARMDIPFSDSFPKLLIDIKHSA
jgi:hypothetical protein